MTARINESMRRKPRNKNIGLMNGKNMKILILIGSALFASSTVFAGGYECFITSKNVVTKPSHESKAERKSRIQLENESVLANGSIASLSSQYSQCVGMTFKTDGGHSDFPFAGGTATVSITDQEAGTVATSEAADASYTKGNITCRIACRYSTDI